MEPHKHKEGNHHHHKHKHKHKYANGGEKEKEVEQEKEVELATSSSSPSSTPTSLAPPSPSFSPVAAKDNALGGKPMKEKVKVKEKEGDGGVEEEVIIPSADNDGMVEVPPPVSFSPVLPTTSFLPSSPFLLPLPPSPPHPFKVSIALDEPNSIEVTRSFERDADGNLIVPKKVETLDPDQSVYIKVSLLSSLPPPHTPKLLLTP